MRHLMRTLLVVLLGLPLIASGLSASADTPEETGSERLDDALTQPGVATSIIIGRALLESGDAVGALPYYQNAWRGDPTSRETGIRLSEVAVMARRPDIAIEVLTSLLEDDPVDVAVGVRLARLQMLMGAEAEAGKLAEDLHAAHPGDRDVLELRLDLQQSRHDYEAALVAVDELIETFSENAALRTRRGEILARLDRLAEAEADWRRALELDPGFSEASLRLSELLLSQGREEELVEELQRLVDEGLADPRQSAALADLYLRSGRVEEAAAILLPMASSGDLDRAGQLHLVQLLGDLGRQQEALDLLDLLEEEGASLLPLQQIRGELLLDLGDYEGAEAALRLALETDPDDNNARLTLLLVLSGRDPSVFDPRAGDDTEFVALLDEAAADADRRSLRQQFLVGAMLRRLGRWEEAVGHLEHAASLPGAGEQVLFELAVAQQESGKVRAAAGTLEQLLKRQPDSPDYLNFYGYLLAEDGRELDRARGMIERALEADPDNGAYVDSLGWVYYKQGDLESALDQLIRAVNLVGDDPIVLEHLGDCLRDLDRIEEARRTYERALEAGAPRDRIEERLNGLEQDEAP
jgi:tetratricopeptide (TPR) repeat protein